MPDIFKNVQIEIRFNGHLMAHGEFPFADFDKPVAAAQYGEAIFQQALKNAREQLSDEDGAESV